MCSYHVSLGWFREGALPREGALGCPQASVPTDGTAGVWRAGLTFPRATPPPSPPSPGRGDRDSGHGAGRGTEPDSRQMRPPDGKGVQLALHEQVSTSLTPPCSRRVRGGRRVCAAILPES